MNTHDLNNTMVADLYNIFVEKGMDAESARKCAVANVKLDEAMSESVVTFTYRKKDGSIRVAYGTTKSALINYVPNGRGRPAPLHLKRYYDVQKCEYRQFAKANLISVGLAA